MEVAYPDTLVGTDSHTTMVNGLSVLGWGVGGIEAEAAMLGQPYSMVLPEVIGVKLTGKLKEGMTATDLVLTVTQMLRKRGVVGKFVEFFGPGLAGLTIADRATIGNMAPEYGATCGFFPIDDDTIDYLTDTARKAGSRSIWSKAYAKAQGMYRTKTTPDPIFTDVLKLELGQHRAVARRPEAPAGPRRAEGGQVELHHRDGQGVQQGQRRRQQGVFDCIRRSPPRWTRTSTSRRQGASRSRRLTLGHGDVVIAAITSCTNTSNPSVMVAAGLLARKAVAKGLKVEAVGEDLARAGLAGGRRLSTRSPACRRISTRSASTWSASAAPPASAIPVRCRRKSPKRSTRTIWSPPRCSRAIATSKAASTPTCAPTISPRRRWWSPMRSPARCMSMSPSSRSASTRRARRSSSRTSGRPAARSTR